MSESKIPFKRQFIFTGPTVLSDGRTALGFLPLDDGGKPSPTTLLFPRRKGQRHFAVGHVYLIEGSADADGDSMSLSLGTREWVEEFPDAVKVATWQAAALASQRKAAAAAVEKREATNTSGLEAAMKPLQVAYSRLPVNLRPAFETWVLSTLRRTK